jgi:N-acetylglucosaminyldiphosphoundecaprenol N-acetyl-beta-D-mannosaminyltransferase
MADPIAPAALAPRTRLAGIDLDGLSEAGVVSHVLESLRRGEGGWIVTPNVDICRHARRDSSLRDLVAQASLAVPDGTPLLWAARILGRPLAERVTGASLIFTLSEAAAAAGRSIYLLGGEPGVPERAAEQLRGRYLGLTVAGTDAPPAGFQLTEEGMDAVRVQAVGAAPDLVFVGLGFPKQEQLIASLAPHLPTTWFVACGAAIPFAAGTLSRAPRFVQRSGMEWLFRLISEPRRLARRYLVDDLPFAVGLLAASAAERVRSAIRPGLADRRSEEAGAVQDEAPVRAFMPPGLTVTAASSARGRATAPVPRHKAENARRAPRG